jgi:hypothetical protein
VELDSDASKFMIDPSKDQELDGQGIRKSAFRNTPSGSKVVYKKTHVALHSHE